LVIGGQVEPPARGRDSVRVVDLGLDGDDVRQAVLLSLQFKGSDKFGSGFGKMDGSLEGLAIRDGKLSGRGNNLTEMAIGLS
jgi:hypothetical protein